MPSLVNHFMIQLDLAAIELHQVCKEKLEATSPPGWTLESHVQESVYPTAIFLVRFILQPLTSWGPETDMINHELHLTVTHEKSLRFN